MKILLLIVLAIAGLVALFLLFPIFVRAHYRGEELECYAWVGPFKVDILADAERREMKRQKRAQWRKNRSTLEWVKQRLRDYLDDLEQIIELLPILRRVLIVDSLYARIRFHEEDPAELALRYGQSWAVIGSVMAILQGLFDIRKQDFVPIDDPACEGYDLEFHIKLHLNLWNAIRVVTKYYTELGKYPDTYNYKNKKKLPDTKET